MKKDTPQYNKRLETQRLLNVWIAKDADAVLHALSKRDALPVKQTLVNAITAAAGLTGALPADTAERLAAAQTRLDTVAELYAIQRENLNSEYGAFQRASIFDDTQMFGNMTIRADAETISRYKGAVGELYLALKALTEGTTKTLECRHRTLAIIRQLLANIEQQDVT